MTPGEAIAHLVAQLIPLAKDDLFPEIGQVDFWPAEDGTVSVSVHLADGALNGGLPVMSNFDLADVFREEFETAIYAAAVLHKALGLVSQVASSTIGAPARVVLGGDSFEADGSVADAQELVSDNQHFAERG